MSFLKPTTPKDLLIHIGAIIGLSIIAILFTFFVWLPLTTNHGDSISVPDVVGMEVAKLDDFLGDRNLRYEVTKDSSYSPDYPPLSVLVQVPPADAKVKENRKIYVTLNAERPPLVKMPEIEDHSLKSAQMVLKSYSLKLGKIKYVPDEIFGVVHEAKMNGRTLLAGEKIEKGSVVDLVVGDGYGNQVFKAPKLKGLELEEAKFVIVGSGLKVGKIQYRQELPDPTDSALPGTVVGQIPEPNSSLRVGDLVDLWVYQPNGAASEGTVLDEEN